jgi:hypothetical protein
MRTDETLTGTLTLTHFSFCFTKSEVRLAVLVRTVCTVTRDTVKRSSVYCMSDLTQQNILLQKFLVICLILRDREHAVLEAYLPTEMPHVSSKVPCHACTI